MAQPANPTYLAECFWPDVHADEVERGAERIRQTAAELGVSLAGTILVPRDDVVFYLFDGGSADAVREACTRAGVPFERVVESVRGS